MTDRDTLLERELRDTFDTLASAYTPVRLPDDLWTSARAQRRTDRVRVLAAVAVVIALLGGLVAVQQGSGALLPAATSEGGTLPQDLYLPDDEEIADAWARGDVSQSPDIGRVSVATLTSSGVPLLLSAHTGEHHLVDLPDLPATIGGLHPTLHVSPDGWRIAHPVTSDRAATAGIAVLDLRTGSTVSLDLRSDGDPVEISQIAWSPDSSRLAWTGNTYEPGRGPKEDAATIIGASDADLGDLREWTYEGDSPTEIVVGDDGQGFLITDQLIPFGDAASGTRIDARSGRGIAEVEDLYADRGAALSADGRALFLGGPDNEADYFTHLEVDLPPVSATAGSAPSLTSSTSWPMDSDIGLYLDLLGVSPAGVVVATQKIGPITIEASSSPNDFRLLTTLHGANDTPLSVATDLADTASVDFPPPPWAPAPPWKLIGLAALLVGLLVVVAVLGRRRARLKDGDSARRPRWPFIVVGVTFVMVFVVALALRLFPLAPPKIVLAVALVGFLGLLSGLRRRRRVATPGAGTVTVWAVVTFCLLATLLALTLPWPVGDDVEVPAGALPETVHFPPDYQNTYSIDETATTDLAVGRASAVARGSMNPLVMVGAEDGRHRLVTLPGQEAIMGQSEGWPATLSPDGTHLAWSFVELANDTKKTTAGIRLADLHTGRTTQLRIIGPRDRPVRVDEIVWSPDGTRIAWRGDEARQWDEGGSNWVGPLGQVGAFSVPEFFADPDTAVRQWSLPRSAALTSAIAVDSSGQALVLSGRRLWTLPASPRDTTPVSRLITDYSQEWSGVAISPDGRRLVTGLNDSQTINSYASGLMVLDLTDPAAQLERHPWVDFQSGSLTRALGWTSQGDVVVSHSDHSNDLKQVSLISDDGSVTPSTRLGQSQLDISVATQLAPRIADFPEPIWPRSDERWWALGLLGVAALGAALMLGQTVRRRTPRGNRNTAPRV